MTRASSPGARGLKSSTKALHLLAAAVMVVGCMPRETARAVPAPSPGSTSVQPVSVVVVQVNGVDVDWTAPWGSGQPWTRTLTGLAVDGPRILVGGWGLRNARHVEVQKPGNLVRAPAKVAIFDDDAGLAILTVEDPAFWVGVVPAVLSSTQLAPHAVKLLHAPAEGMRIESSDGIVARFEIDGHCEFVHMRIGQIDAQRVGSSDVVGAGGRVAGLVMGGSNGEVIAVGVRTLHDFVSDALRPPYRGCATADFFGQKVSSAPLRAALGLGPDEGGWLVSRVWPQGSSGGVLEAGDVVLSVDGTKVDSDGTYADAVAGRISFLALFSQGHHPGDALSIQLVRRGERRSVDVVLKRWPAAQTLVPWFSADSHGYALHGGLVFQRLSHEYLLTFGKDWETRAPARLLEPYELDRFASTAERPEIVVMTAVLPVPATLGYEHLGNLVVESVNGAPARSLADVSAAFGRPAGGFHVVTFAPGQGIERIVLDVQEAKDADALIREKYHVVQEDAAPAGTP